MFHVSIPIIAKIEIAKDWRKGAKVKKKKAASYMIVDAWIKINFYLKRVIHSNYKETYSSHFKCWAFICPFICLFVIGVEAEIS